VRQLFDPDRVLRSEAEWRLLLGGLVESLSAFTGVRFEPTSWFVGDDRPDYACATNRVDIRGSVNPTLRLDACGVVCVTVNFGEAAWASCDLLLFVSGRRVRGPGGPDFVLLLCSEAGWLSRGWMLDDTGEWESHTTDARWTGA